MFASPPLPRRSPKRSSPKRIPLHERSESQRNEIPFRLVRDAQGDPNGGEEFANPFPTKPARVLLPSAVRSHGFPYQEDNRPISPTFLTPSNRLRGRAKGLDNATQPASSQSSAPTLSLERSVAVLRDMYESQGSRPITAVSSRPSTAASPPLGVVTFREGWRGFGTYHSTYPDEAITLPSLEEASSTLRTITSEASVQSQSTSPPESSSPSIGATRTDDTAPWEMSSPNIVQIERSSSPYSLESFEAVSLASDAAAAAVLLGTASDADARSITSNTSIVPRSSPNFIHLLGSSSSTPNFEPSSSPNILRLNSSSSINGSESSNPEVDYANSTETIKRHFSEISEDNHPRINSDFFSSSPPLRPLDLLMSTPVFEPSDVENTNPDHLPPNIIPGFRLATTAGSEVRSINTPPAAAACRVNDVSEANSGTHLESSPPPNAKFPTVAAPTSQSLIGLHIPKRGARKLAEPPPGQLNGRLLTESPDGFEEVSGTDGPPALAKEDRSDIESIIEPPRAYFTLHRGAGSSTGQLVSEADRHEAIDNIGNLRPRLRTTASGLLSTRSSTDSRSNSICRSFLSSPKSRHDSLRNIRRPTSSSSLASNLPIPSWARRYYSGNYSDFFYPYGQIPSSNELRPCTARPNSRPATAQKPRPQTIHDFGPQTTHTSQPHTTHAVSLEHVPINVFRPRPRTREGSRHSHLLPGLGPLVSNPTRVRPASIPLYPADPRSHWAGAQGTSFGAATHQPGATEGASQGPNGVREWSPHLHHDINAGPHPRRSLWQPPSVDSRRRKVLSMRNVQRIGFISGFLLPLNWFVAAMLPLPSKKSHEKDSDSSRSIRVSELRLSRHLHSVDDICYENARWWRNLNRFMCAVGVIVIVLVIILAVLGTRPGGF